MRSDVCTSVRWRATGSTSVGSPRRGGQTGSRGSVSSTSSLLLLELTRPEGPFSSKATTENSLPGRVMLMADSPSLYV